MKETLTQQLRQMFADAMAYLKLQIEEGKLVGAEKGAILLSTAAVCMICCSLGIFTIFLFAMALVSVFKMIMAEWLAYVCVGGILLLLSVIVVLLRTHLIVNPVCRFLTRLVFDNKEPRN